MVKTLHTNVLVSNDPVPVVRMSSMSHIQAQAQLLSTSEKSKPINTSWDLRHGQIDSFRYSAQFQVRVSIDSKTGKPYALVLLPSAQHYPQVGNPLYY